MQARAKHLSTVTSSNHAMVVVSIHDYGRCTCAAVAHAVVGASSASHHGQGLEGPHLPAPGQAGGCLAGWALGRAGKPAATTYEPVLEQWLTVIRLGWVAGCQVAVTLADITVKIQLLDIATLQDPDVRMPQQILKHNV